MNERRDSSKNNISLYVQLHERLGTILENIEGMHEEFNKINDKMNLLDQRSKMMNENICLLYTSPSPRD